MLKHQLNQGASYKQLSTDELSKRQQATRQRSLYQLKRDIAILKKHGCNYRDLAPGSPAWNAYLRAFPLQREEAESWLHGPVLCITELTAKETTYWMHSGNKIHMYPGEVGQFEVTKLAQVDTRSKFDHIIWVSENYNCSWIYAPNEPGNVIDALNLLMRYWSKNVRFQGELPILPQDL